MGEEPGVWWLFFLLKERASFCDASFNMCVEDG
jgi:hypothetical protein